LDRLVSFDEVATVGSIKKAAGIMRRASTYSKQINELEDFFEVALTEKVGNKLRLTERGKELAMISRGFFSSLEYFNNCCRERSCELRLGVGDALIHWLIAPKLREIQKALGKVRIWLPCLERDEALTGLDNQTLDFAIVRRDEIPKGYANAPLGIYKYLCLVPSELMESVSETDQSTLLRLLPLVITKSDWTVDFEALHKEDAGLDLNIQVVCESWPQAAQFLKTRAYAAILPAFSRRDFDEKDFISIAVPFLTKCQHEMALTWKRSALSKKPLLKRAPAILKSELHFG